jgi:hypothetical protein
MSGDLLIDTPHGKKRWGFVRRAIESHDELLAACRQAQRYFDDMGPVLGESDAAHNERMVRLALQDAIAKAEGVPDA